MKILKINNKNPDPDTITQAKEYLKQGKIVVYPTDTVYGIAANAYNESAVSKVFDTKKRLKTKAVSLCLAEIEAINDVAFMDNKTEILVEQLFPGPFTVIMRKKEQISPLLTGGTNKIGIRIPDNKLSRDLASEFPITSTSANISGLNVPETPKEVVEQLGDSVDLVLDAGVCKYGYHSTVVDMTGDKPIILRMGAGYETLMNLL
ncbi:Sua5/YciO/YrdC/YwlC family protein [Methanobacterium lacus]|uniref:L-threonylcarbamoyladenylate synthase n=1 Tax=Methanobacterium lacus (strain AL-21) TaxID=877455 RepID=F0TA15_METLA|nr:L-threonylcarbamoyladenylate synthase [Methanobacterium lacus]ADZ08838.1 Sua5/YciO/YrdC/YwlC family protein [Methanobacterium lacus]